MRIGILIAAFLIACTAASASLTVDVTLSDNYVREAFVYTGDPGLVSFELPTEPVSVSSDASYTLSGSTIELDASTTPLRFSALFDDLIVSSGSERVFRSSFSADDVSLSITLPQSATLDETIPQGELSTDGERITVSWPAASQRSVAVFYTIESDTPWLLIVAFSLPIIAGLLFLVYWNTQRRANERAIDALLSSDEKDVLGWIDGERTQQDIAKELDYSKSKMSKVVRKLEEKGLVGKEPHFKTNKLKRL